MEMDAKDKNKLGYVIVRELTKEIRALDDKLIKEWEDRKKIDPDAVKEKIGFALIKGKYFTHEKVNRALGLIHKRKSFHIYETEKIDIKTILNPIIKKDYAYKVGLGICKKARAVPVCMEEENVLKLVVTRPEAGYVLQKSIDSIKERFLESYPEVDAQKLQVACCVTNKKAMFNYLDNLKGELGPNADFYNM